MAPRITLIKSYRYKETLRLLYKLWKIQLKSRWKYRKTVKSYYNRRDELTNIAFWKKYLDI